MSQAPPDPRGADSGREAATLEDVLDRLEGAVRRLADQSAPLERMVADWEQAQALVRDAERRLEEIEDGLRREAGEAEDRGGNGPAA